MMPICPASGDRAAASGRRNRSAGGGKREKRGIGAQLWYKKRVTGVSVQQRGVSVRATNGERSWQREWAVGGPHITHALGLGPRVGSHRSEKPDSVHAGRTRVG